MSHFVLSRFLESANGLSLGKESDSRQLALCRGWMRVGWMAAQLQPALAVGQPVCVSVAGHSLEGHSLAVFVRSLGNRVLLLLLLSYSRLRSLLELQ